jgi:formin-binding protein 1
LALLENEKTTLETEVHTVLTVVRDIDAGAKPHSFKSTSFVAPTTCAFCNKSIWGLAGGKGFICTGKPSQSATDVVECGYTCHAKCQMKAPQDCTGVNLKLEAKKSKKKKKGKEGEEGDDDESIFSNGHGSLKRTSTSSSVTPSTTSNTIPSPRRTDTTSSIRKTSARHIAGAPAPTKYITPVEPIANGGTVPKAKVLYKYDAGTPEELSVTPSDTITIVEPDDGSGWILARVGKREGLVPASYVEVVSEAPKKGPPVAPRRGGKKADEPKKKYVRALYDYDGASELELSIREGDVVVVVSEDKGDGWTEVELKGKIGSVPSNYVEVVDKS